MDLKTILVKLAVAGILYVIIPALIYVYQITNYYLVLIVIYYIVVPFLTLPLLIEWCPWKCCYLRL